MLALLGHDVLEAVDAVLPLQGAGVTYVIDGAAHRLREDVGESGFATVVVLSELHEPPSEIPGSSIARPPVELTDRPLVASRLAVIDQLPDARLVAECEIGGSTSESFVPMLGHEPLVTLVGAGQIDRGAWEPMVAAVIQIIIDQGHESIVSQSVQDFITSLSAPPTPQPGGGGGGGIGGAGTAGGTSGATGATSTSGPTASFQTGLPSPGQRLSQLTTTEFETIATGVRSYVVLQCRGGNGSLRAGVLGGAYPMIYRAEPMAYDEVRALQMGLAQALGVQVLNPIGVRRDVQVCVLQAGA